MDLLIRADANAEMGTGHLMRCLALGQAWKDIGGKVTFVTGCTNEQLLQRLYGESFIIHRLERSYPEAQDLQVTQQLLARLSGAWLVIDGYHFDSAYQQEVKRNGYPLLVIDDMAHLPHYYSDIVLNQNIQPRNLSYSCEPYTKLLLGPSYVLLRREFLKWRGWKRNVPSVARRVLVTMGGGASHAAIEKVIQALKELSHSEMEVSIVVGPANPYFELIKSEISSFPCKVHLLPSVDNMAELMAWADVAVSAAGSTSWEIAYMQLPSVLLILADNQKPIAEELDQIHAAVNLGWAREVLVDSLRRNLFGLLESSTLRREMSCESKRLIDGNGARRVIQALQASQNFRSVENAHSLSG
jgi:UDP-2,4-diacetamido-2,4,6-trideoxy-beta-L-altropyranose hydrolase